MKRGGFNFLRMSFATLYALATLVTALVVSTHAGHNGRSPAELSHPASVATSIQAPICGKHDGGDGKSRIAASCCDACQANGPAGLEAASFSSFFFRHEISTRLHFQCRLGRVADATPDNLRSRAPPA
jgi:hypothetical protein